MGSVTRIEIEIDGQNIKAIKSLDGVESKLKGLDKKAKESNTAFDKVTGSFTAMAGALGIAFGINEIVDFTKKAVLASAELEVLRNNFKGSTEDIELFKKATAGTVGEASLLKLSNQATDLGLSIEEQAKFFYLAENAADKYSTSIEEGFQRVVYATDGQVKGLKAVGIQKAVYNTIVDQLARAQGDEIEKLDAETQKHIRVQAVLQATGITMEDVNNQTVDAKDRFEKFGVALEETTAGFGDFVRDSSRGWYDLVSAFVQGGPLMAQMVMQTNIEADILLSTLNRIKETYRETIDYAGAKAEQAVVGKSKQQLEIMIQEAKNSVAALEKLRSKKVLDAYDKNELEQAEKKLQVYQSTYEVLTHNKEAIKQAEELSKAWKSVQNELVHDNMKIGLSDFWQKENDLVYKANELKAKFYQIPGAVDLINYRLSRQLNELYTIGEVVEKIQKGYQLPEEKKPKVAPSIDVSGIESAENIALQASQNISAGSIANFLVMQDETAAIFGSMADSLYMAYEQMGGTSEAWFNAYKAIAISETIISTIQAAQKSYTWASTWGGPVAGAIAAAVASAAGLARIGQITSTGPGTGGSVSSGSGGSYSMPSSVRTIAGATTNNNTTNAPTVTMIFNGDNIDMDAWLRKNRAALQRLFNDGVIKVGNG